MALSGVRMSCDALLKNDALRSTVERAEASAFSSSSLRISSRFFSRSTSRKHITTSPRRRSPLWMMRIDTQRTPSGNVRRKSPPNSVTPSAMSARMLSSEKLFSNSV